MNGEYSFDYLKLLSKDYPSIRSVSAEIIKLQAILNLPKGTEHFVSDLHGENEAFLHVLRNASGVIKEKIDDLYANSLCESDRSTLATLCYYPNQKLYYLKGKFVLNDEWYKLNIYRLIELCRVVASKYSRLKVRQACDCDFSHIIEELLYSPAAETNKHEYYNQIIDSIIQIGVSEDFIVSISKLIRRLSIEHLHILGDVFDRGPRADIIMEELCTYHSVDFQWGNHDIEWIGAACGNTALIANVVRNSLKYNNFDVLETGYGINTRTLTSFAYEMYNDDECDVFMPLDSHKHTIHTHDSMIVAKMHKAISIIQFKLEGQLISRHPEFEMDDRALLGCISADCKTITINGIEYKLKDTHFPTLDINDPYKLTDEENAVILSLKQSFLHSEKLQKHIRFMINNGGMYKIYNGNLLYHGCIPLDKNGEFQYVDFFGEKLCGKSYLDKADKYVRTTYFSKGLGFDISDYLWYLWCGKSSPLFGKEKYTTFEGYYIDNHELLNEPKNAYYKYIVTEDCCKRILEVFGLEKDKAHIINGHVPVKSTHGESPVKANGKLYVIDGGFSKPYQETTGIAGYTLINNSYGFSITEHQPFTGVSDVISKDSDLHSNRFVIENYPERCRIIQTDFGKSILKRIDELNCVLDAYRKGTLTELQQ